VLCINDGSSDGSRDIIMRYVDSDPRFRLIDKPNSGYGASMNRGLDEARGCYIAILESDDFWEPNALECLCQAADAHDAQVVKANFWFYYSTREQANQLNELISPKVAGLVDPAQFPQLFWYMPSIWSAIYRRDFLQANDIRFMPTPGASYQDLSFTFKVWAYASRVVLLHQAFVHYRQDNEASSINAPGKVFCVRDEFAQIESFVEAREDRKRLHPIKARLKYDSYYWNFWRLNQQLRYEFYPVMVEELMEELSRGHIDYSMFYPWDELNVRAITSNPSEYEAWARRTGGEQPSVAAMLRYLKIGGLPLLIKRLRFKWD
jgi:glycosyltransferase involved in cell wall biosynthesis